jgi:hypothetical protein
MKKLEWFQRSFTFGIPPGMLPFLIDRLEGTIVRLGHKIADQADSTLSQKFDGKWSIKQNIGHLAEVDAIALLRIDEMIKGITPMSSAVFEPMQDYDSQPITDVFNLFRKNRLENLKTYQSLSDADLLKFSLHPRLKVKMNPVDLAFFDAEHDDHHLVRITEILKALHP